MSRRIARETALQVMFQINITKAEPNQALEYTFAEFAVPESSQAFARRLVEGTLDRLEELDSTIQAVSKEWNLARMANVDRNIIRLAAFELFHCPEIPGSVTVNEAVELAKTYSGAEAGKFVNGILGVLLERSGKSKNLQSAKSNNSQSGQNLAKEPAILSDPGQPRTLQADIQPVVDGEQL